MTRRLLAALAVVLWVAAWPAVGVELSGRVASDLYSYEEAGEGHLRPHLSFRSTLTAWRGQENGQLSFHSYVRWRTDVTNKYDGDPQTFVYEAYARLKDMPKGSIFSFGRQYVYSGLSSRLIDGARVRFHYGSRIEVSAYGGARVSRLNPEKGYGLNERGSLGGRISYASPLALRVGLAWMLDKIDGEVTDHRIGLDAEKRFVDVNLFSRLTYDVPARRLNGVMARVNYRPGLWRMTAEYGWRYPSVAHNSLFSLIDYGRRSEIRFDLSRTVWRNLALVTRSWSRLEGNDQIWSASVGLRTPDYRIAWRYQDGDGGRRSGLNCSVRWRYRSNLEAYASADLSRYRVQREQVGLSDAYSAALGVRWENKSGLSTGLEGQYLRNAVVTSDYRILLRVSKSFALGGRKGW